MHPELGDFVRVRDRRWLVEAIRELSDGLQTLTLPGIDDDALAEQTDIVWAAEIDAEVLKQDLRTITWNTASAADQRLLPAPFRAGIRLDAYQLLPPRKALQLPRVNLLIADDVG